MKIYAVLLYIILFNSCASGKEMSYTGSTPADPVVRIFLGIPLPDSVDFIRWKIIFHHGLYLLQCNYGIGKPNTNGFINGGKKIEISDKWKREKNILQLQHGNKILKLAELNPDLLHLLNKDNNLLVGNGGWSYTLNNTNPSGTDQVNISSASTSFEDSIVYQGRTPCGVPGIIANGTECYKLKWLVILYSNTGLNDSGTYRLMGTPWYKEGARTGNWKIIAGKKGQTIFQLNDKKGNGFIYLLKLDKNILQFTNANGKLLVGDEDFSYTLNRVGQ